jgi:hypothetical protein
VVHLFRDLNRGSQSVSCQLVGKMHVRSAVLELYQTKGAFGTAAAAAVAAVAVAVLVKRIL